MTNTDTACQDDEDILDGLYTMHTMTNDNRTTVKHHAATKL